MKEEEEEEEEEYDDGKLEKQLRLIFCSHMETKVRISPQGVELAREGSVSGSGVILRLS